MRHPLISIKKCCRLTMGFRVDGHIYINIAKFGRFNRLAGSVPLAIITILTLFSPTGSGMMKSTYKFPRNLPFELLCRIISTVRYLGVLSGQNIFNGLVLYTPSVSSLGQVAAGRQAGVIFLLLLSSL